MTSVADTTEAAGRGSKCSLRRSFALISTAVPVLIGLLAAGSGVTGTAAQDGTPSAITDHPLVGAWLLSHPDDPGFPPTLVVFTSDGV